MKKVFNFKKGEEECWDSPLVTFLAETLTEKGKSGFDIYKKDYKVTIIVEEVKKV